MRSGLEGAVAVVRVFTHPDLVVEQLIGQRGRLVRLADVEALAALTGRTNGNGKLPADSAVATPGNVAEVSVDNLQTAALTAIEQQLAKYRDMIERLHRVNLTLFFTHSQGQTKLGYVPLRSSKKPELVKQKPNGPDVGENGPDSAAGPLVRRHWRLFRR